MCNRVPLLKLLIGQIVLTTLFGCIIIDEYSMLYGQVTFGWMLL